MNTLAGEMCENGEHNVQLFPKKPGVFTLLFLNDTVGLSDTAMGLQNQLSTLRKASETLELIVNGQKIKVMVFRSNDFLEMLPKAGSCCSRCKLPSS